MNATDVKPRTIPGVRVGQVSFVWRPWLVGVTLLLAGAATAACGPIAFLGLMVAHVARSLTGPDYRWLVPYAGLLGAVLLLVCDIVGRVVVRPGELDAGVVVSLLGAPFFAVLVWRGKFRSA